MHRHHFYHNCPNIQDSPLQKPHIGQSEPQLTTAGAIFFRFYSQKNIHHSQSFCRKPKFWCQQEISQSDLYLSRNNQHICILDMQEPLVPPEQRKEQRTRLSYRLLTMAIFAGSIVVDILISNFGAHPADKISDQYKLYVTPPGWMFSIWGLIYVVTGITILYVIYYDLWESHAYTLMNIVNISNAAWVGVWSIDTMTSIIICSGIIVLIPTFLFALWVYLYDPKPYGWQYYAIRNSVALYLGWVLGASILNFGIVLVYHFNFSEKQFLIIFWILVPLLAIGATITTATMQGINGFKSSFCLWITVLWALSGALISTLNNKDRI